ncbi:molybdate ABC transporter substrate-binding protein [Microbacterium sp. CH12i]|uniref:molybdate ABC transporter substrate-binding protein n=1 Tax=Microbacterium sp. CH12i TaxID=1479651 RepID=UPI000B0AE435
MNRILIRRAAVAAGVIAALALSGCAAPADVAPEGETTAPTAIADDISGELTVYAAASLTGAFDELATQFEQQHPDIDVLPISYDGSSVLATQLIEARPPTLRLGR